MDIITLLILTVATWRLSSLLVDETGPFDAFAELRYWIGVRLDRESQTYGTNEIAKIFTCVWCMSIWIGIMLTVSYAIIPVYTSWICLPFALSTGAIGLNAITK